MKNNQHDRKEISTPESESEDHQIKAMIEKRRSQMEAFNRVLAVMNNPRTIEQNIASGKTKHGWLKKNLKK